MIALIAPAKRLDYDSDLSVEDFSIAEHLKESKKLIKELTKQPVIWTRKIQLSI